MRDKRSVAIAAVALLTLGGCDWYYNTLPSPDDAVKLVPWFDHMVTSPAFHPYERGDIPRRSVPGTVPIDQVEPDWDAEWNNGAGTTTANAAVNPTDPAATIAVGDTVYHVYCAVCHGTSGAGEGSVGRRVGAPSLLTPRAMGFPDGYIYSTIRYGRGIMPRYGDKIVTPEARWAVVNYVRRLQAAAGGGTP